MRTFTDALNRSWSIEITVATLKRVRALTTVDLMDIVSGTLIDRLLADPVLLGDVLYACVKSQADERKLTDEDFGRALAGDCIEAATVALLEALALFFPNPRRRVLEKLLHKLAGWRAQAIAAAEARLDDPALEQTVAMALAAPGSSSGSVRASSASTPPD